MCCVCLCAPPSGRCTSTCACSCGLCGVRRHYSVASGCPRACAWQSRAGVEANPTRGRTQTESMDNRCVDGLCPLRTPPHSLGLIWRRRNGSHLPIPANAEGGRTPARVMPSGNRATGQRHRVVQQAGRRFVPGASGAQAMVLYPSTSTPSGTDFSRKRSGGGG